MEPIRRLGLIRTTIWGLIMRDKDQIKNPITTHITRIKVLCQIRRVSTIWVTIKGLNPIWSLRSRLMRLVVRRANSNTLMRIRKLCFSSKRKAMRLQQLNLKKVSKILGKVWKCLIFYSLISWKTYLKIRGIL